MHPERKGPIHFPNPYIEVHNAFPPKFLPSNGVPVAQPPFLNPFREGIWPRELFLPNHRYGGLSLLYKIVTCPGNVRKMEKSLRGHLHPQYSRNIQPLYKVVNKIIDVHPYSDEYLRIVWNYTDETGHLELASDGPKMLSFGAYQCLRLEKEGILMHSDAYPIHTRNTQ